MGIVQGLTEFLPVSSTAHLILFPWFFGWKGELDSLTFDVALHAGTLIALLICFWRDWIEMLFSRRRLLFLIIIATVPAGVLGKLFNDMIEERLRSPYIISASLVVIGIFMLLAETGRKRRSLDGLAIGDAVSIGLSQAVALIPGVSRSGITIASGLLRGFDRESAARFSFLLSTPVIAGAVLLHMKKMLSSPVQHDLRLFSVGVISSAVTGFIAIKFLLGFLRRHGLHAFAYYRFALAAVILTALWLKR
ncbi:MAG: undecaprenyl-diphosphate phosphatase [Nitrospiraceae bacterium]|nr:undecaprenyl-diphosphate phosphatase [Nitrospiraceae bacterium]